MLGKRLIILRDLITLRQIRVEVVLARKSENGRISQFSAMPAPMAISTASRQSTGRAPGIPRQTGQTLLFGSAPKLVGQLQKILVRVPS